jgi:hypothetical protein
VWVCSCIGSVLPWWVHVIPTGERIGFPPQGIMGGSGRRSRTQINIQPSEPDDM